MLSPSQSGGRGWWCWEEERAREDGTLERERRFSLRSFCNENARWGTSGIAHDLVRPEGRSGGGAARPAAG